jgi:serine/threonine-protein kinase
MWETPFLERNPIVSPDGRWLAYEANPAGELEIFVRPFPNVGERQWQVSSGGGRQPLWSRNGRELFYIESDGSLVTVPVQTREPTWNAGSPVRLLPGRPLYALGSGFAPRMYDVSPDGRFLMVRQGRDGTEPPPQIVVVQNWQEELKRLVPPR